MRKIGTVDALYCSPCGRKCSESCVLRALKLLIFLPMVLVVAIIQGSARSVGDDWPMWRGPRGDGISLETKAPLEWSPAKNIGWKTAIPGDGRSSPIVSGDSVFVTTSLTETHSRRLIRIDRQSGETIWNVEIHCGPTEQQHKFNTSASSTPATDGTRVYCSFVDSEKMVVSAVDWNGRIEWTTSPGSYESKHGFAASPIVCPDDLTHQRPSSTSEKSQSDLEGRSRLR